MAAAMDTKTHQENKLVCDTKAGPVFVLKCGHKFCESCLHSLHEGEADSRGYEQPCQICFKITVPLISALNRKETVTDGYGYCHMNMINGEANFYVSYIIFVLYLLF